MNRCDWYILAGIEKRLLPACLNRQLLFQVGNAVKTDKGLYQYVDLGDLSAACITIPDTCGPEGGSISLWFKLEPCDGNMGLISSVATFGTGFSLSCNSGGLQ